MERAQRRKLLDKVMAWFMRLSIAGSAGILVLILAIIVWRGLPGLSWELISQPPEGSFYLGGGGGVLNAILGSCLLYTSPSPRD